MEIHELGDIVYFGIDDNPLILVLEAIAGAREDLAAHQVAYFVVLGGGCQCFLLSEGNIPRTLATSSLVKVLSWSVDICRVQEE